jgi:hypothetical protein
MPKGRKKTTKGFANILERYKSGRNIIDELTKINDSRINNKVNEMAENFCIMCESASLSNHPHYFLTLLLHEKKDAVEKNSWYNQFTKNCLCSFYTSVYRDTLRKVRPEIFNVGKYKITPNN